MCGAIASAIVFTALAPIASRQSTTRWVTTMWPRFVSTTRTSTSFAPPPSFTSIGSFSFATEGIRDPDELDRANHDGTGRARREAAPSPGHPGRVRGRGDDARLLDRHRD